MPVERLEDIPRDPVRLHAVPDHRNEPRKPLDEQVLQVISALSAILAVRAIMALAIVGSFVLTFMAVQNPAVNSLWGLGIFDATVVLPLVWLAQHRG